MENEIKSFERTIKCLDQTISLLFFVTCILSFMWFLVLVININNTTKKIEDLQESVNKQRQEVASLRIFISELEDSDGE